MTLLNGLDLRTAVAASLTTRLVSTYAVQVHAEPPTDFAGKSPLVVIANMVIDRTAVGTQTFGGSIAPKVRMDLVAMALATGNADTNLDRLEWQIAEWLDANKQGPYWTAVLYAGPPEKTDVTTITDGKQYRIETIPLLFTGTT